MFSPLAFFCSSVVLISFLLSLRWGFVSWAWLVLPLGSDVSFLGGLFVRTEVFVVANETVGFAYYCHGVILSTSCLFDDHDCEMLECHLLAIVRTELFVVASETIVICLLLSWCDSFDKLSV